MHDGGSVVGAQMGLGLFADFGAAGLDGGDLGVLLGAQVAGVFRVRLFLLRLGAFQCGGDQGVLGFLLGSARRLFRLGQCGGGLFAAGGGLGGKLGGLFLLLAFLAQQAEFIAVARQVGGFLFDFAAQISLLAKR
jgi:hypothetical protein